jgi:hypothetical protein
MALATTLMGAGFPALQALVMSGAGAIGTVTAATTALATGTALRADVNLVTTSGGQTAVVLPFANVGESVIVYVSTATAALVFPESVGVQINEISAGSSFSVAQGKPTTFIKVTTTKWIAVLSA